MIGRVSVDLSVADRPTLLGTAAGGHALGDLQPSWELRSRHLACIRPAPTVLRSASATETGAKQTHGGELLSGNIGKIRELLTSPPSAKWLELKEMSGLPLGTIPYTKSCEFSVLSE